jgi:hypothetical protein
LLWQGNSNAKDVAKTGKESKTFAGWDPNIRADLPTTVLNAFGYFYEHGALVGVWLVKELSYLSQYLPVAAFARMLMERAVGIYHREEFHSDFLFFSNGMVHYVCDTSWPPTPQNSSLTQDKDYSSVVKYWQFIVL